MKYKTIDVYYPNGWMNCSITIDNFFISDTNDSANFDFIKIPLPTPKYGWKIKKYGLMVHVYSQKNYITLIDKP